MNCVVASFLLAFFYHLQPTIFTHIAQLLHLRVRAVQQIFHRASERAGSDRFEEVLAYCGRLERSGRPSVIVNGTPASIALRSLILQLDDHQLQDIAEIWQAQIGQSLARSTVE